MSRIRYIITAGGTREPIDEVRFVGNNSTGQLGSDIADEAFKGGRSVCFIHGHGSTMPECKRRISILGFITSSDLKEILEEKVRNAESPTVLIHAAAVSDYIPLITEGKISSDKEELVLHMRKSEKIVDYIKEWNPDIHLVKFKLESGASKAKLLKIASKAAKQSKADWVVANDTSTAWNEKHAAMIIRGDSILSEAVGKKEIAFKLIEETERAVLSI